MKQKQLFICEWEVHTIFSIAAQGLKFVGRSTTLEYYIGHYGKLFWRVKAHSWKLVFILLKY